MSIETGNPLEEQKDKNVIEQKKVSSFETARGSTYTYLPDGKIQRYKKATGETFIMDVIAFIPDWHWIQSHAPKHFLDRFESGGEFEQEILRYIQDKTEELRAWLVNREGKKIDTQADLEKEKSVLIYFGTYEKMHFIVPVVKTPHVGYSPFDTRKYKEGDEWKRQSHIGNKVTKIHFQ